MRALLFFVFILVVYLAIRFTLKRVRELRAASAEAETLKNKPEPEEMVACATCGLHLPKHEAICEVSEAGERCFCSDTHQRQAHKEN